MRRMKTGQLKLLLAGLAAVILCWSAYFMLPSVKKDDRTAQNRHTGVGDQVSASSAESTTQKDVPEIRGKSLTSPAPDRGKVPSGARSATQHKDSKKASEMESSLDEIVIPPSEDGEPGLTLREIQALHEQHEAEMRADSNLDEFVIPPSVDGEPGLTARDILALHEQQEADMKADPDLDDFVIPPSEEGEPGMTMRQVLALHEEQEAEIIIDENMEEFAIPPSEDGEVGLMLGEIQALHEQQESARK